MECYTYSQDVTDNDEHLDGHRPPIPLVVNGIALEPRSCPKPVVADVALSNVLPNSQDSENDLAKPPNGLCSTRYLEGPFHWSSFTQELILASGFYGFPWLQLPAGFLADTNGNAAVWLLAISFGVPAICTLLTPLVAYQGVPLLITIQVISGLTQGWTFPVFIALIGRWAPPSERSRLVTIGSSGIPLAQVIGQPIAGLLSSSESTGGWPSAFYFSGALGVLCSIAWVFLVYPSPSAHPRISPKEPNYIEQNLRLESRVGEGGGEEELPRRSRRTCRMGEQ
ncbi:sialin-like [Lytechinus pictus]|uniref:sialin-like n=1 Tax=Lytechinus pictus TaxID=7653 RepID=UPI0030BA11F3